MQLARAQKNVVDITQQGNVYYLQYRPHQQVTKRRRWVWKPVNRVQAWLEGKDKLPAKAVAYGLLAVTAVYLVAQVVRSFG